MSFISESQALHAYFSGTWGETTPVQYENVDFNPVEGQEWVRFLIINGTGFASSIGGMSHRYPSQVVVEIFTPKNTGPKRSKELAEIVSDMFIDNQFTNPSMTFRTPYIINVGTVDNWHQINVICPFYRDELG